MKTKKQFETPCKGPNGLQWTDEGLFVMDQMTDNVYVVDEAGKLLRTIATPTANGSGITIGGGYLWTASNGTEKTVCHYVPTYDQPTQVWAISTNSI